MIISKKLSDLNKWEYIVPTLAAILLIASCIIISSKKYYWNDELYSYYLLSDQSFSHMLKAFHDKINNTPPLYFLVGWFWAKTFGSTELSLRLFSSIGFCIAFFVTWLSLTRIYNFWSASIGALCAFFTSELILGQNSDARMYGLFLAVCSLGLFQYHVINTTSTFSRKLFTLNVFIHILIVQTHLFGPFYSVGILISLIIRDAYFKFLRPKVYLSIVLSWLSLILYLPSFLNQADAGFPRSWISIPNLQDLIDFLTLSSSPFLILFLLFLIIFSGLIFIFGGKNYSYLNRQQENSKDFKGKVSILILAYTFLTIPILIWLISLLFKPIFRDRYMIPSLLGWSILLCHFSSLIFKDSHLSEKIGIGPLNVLSSKKSFLAFSLLAILLIRPISFAVEFKKETLPGMFDGKFGYKDLPVAVQYSHDFLERYHYSPEHKRYFFVLDWQAAVDIRSGLFPPQEYKHMVALKNNYYEIFGKNILEGKEFLSIYKRFLVLDYWDYDQDCSLGHNLGFHCPRWLEMRIMNNSDYRITPLGAIDDRELLLVEKIT